MSYVDVASRPNPVAALGALGVPAAFAGLLIVGLAVKVVVEQRAPNPSATMVDIKPPEDLPTPEPRPDTAPTSETAPVVIPDPTPSRPDSPITIITGPTAPTGTPTYRTGDWTVPIPPLDPAPPARPAFDPVAAVPKGRPGLWITNDDYRTSWINRGYTGVASFTLSIDAGGRVSGCTITGSTGHAALDEATCRLLERRARFEPARDSSGNAVAGSFRSSVNWTIPE